MRTSRKLPSARPTEDGYVLAAVIILLAILMIFLAAAMPKVRKDIQRDQELETMHRGQQYIRAVQLYYRKFRRFPPNVDALEDTNMQRFLRKRYADPLTGADDWVPVLYGANKAPLSMGYFGKPLTMGAAVLTDAAATTAAGGNKIVGASPIANGSGFRSAFGDSGSNAGQQNPGFSNATPIPGGGGIMGFAPAPEKTSILVYKTKDQYNLWEFVYDPATDRIGSGMLIAPPTGPPVNTGAPGFGGPAMPSPSPNSPQ